MLVRHTFPKVLFSFDKTKANHMSCVSRLGHVMLFVPLEELSVCLSNPKLATPTLIHSSQYVQISGRFGFC